MHIPNEISPERTTSLLSYIGINVEETNGMPLYDLSGCDYTYLENVVSRSKEFLHQVVKQ